ncbi:MAG: DeoR/GlpR family DNA-binding transcription regulator [Clostridia bacterium]
MMTERRQKIDEYIQEKNEATLSQLKELVPGVSEMTIRRDLESLENDGRIVRVHGGAKSIKSISGFVEDVFSKRSAVNIKRKELIAHKAARLVIPESSIYIDSGSTTMALAMRISDVRLLITTNGLNVASELLRLEMPTAYLVGGELSRSSISLSGPQALKCVENMNFDTAFIAATAFSEQAGFTCGSVHDSALKRAVLARAKRRIILMDSTKVGSSMPHTFAHPNEIDTFVSDGELPENITRLFLQNGVELL